MVIHFSEKPTGTIEVSQEWVFALLWWYSEQSRRCIQVPSERWRPDRASEKRWAPHHRPQGAGAASELHMHCGFSSWHVKAPETAQRRDTRRMTRAVRTYPWRKPLQGPQGTALRTKFKLLTTGPERPVTTANSHPQACTVPPPPYRRPWKGKQCCEEKKGVCGTPAHYKYFLRRSSRKLPAKN